MSDMRTILERGVGGAAPPPDGFERMLRRRDRKRRNERIGAWLLGVSIAVAIAVTGFQITRSNSVPIGPTPSPSVPPSPAEQVGDTPDGPYIVNMRTGEAVPLPQSVTKDQGGNYRLSPDGSKLLFQRPGFGGRYGGHEDIPTGQLFVANIDGTKVRQLTHDPEGAKVGGWSPDGTMIVYVGRWRNGADWYEPVETFLFDLTTGGTTRVAIEQARRPREWFFSEDGESIQFYGKTGAGGRTELWSVPLAGGPSTMTLERAGTLSPDGTMILFSLEGRIVRLGGMPAQALWLADADGSDRRLLWQDNDLNSGNALWSPDGTRIAVSDGEVFLIDVATGDPTMIRNGPARVPGHVVAWLDDETLIIETQVPYD